MMMMRAALLTMIEVMAFSYGSGALRGAQGNVVALAPAPSHMTDAVDELAFPASAPASVPTRHDPDEEYDYDAHSNGSYYNFESDRRSLQTAPPDNCMDDQAGVTTGCQANDVEFLSVAGFEVFSEGAYVGADGTTYGACRGSDDNIRVAFRLNFNVKSTKYDVGMFVATQGNTALRGQCEVVGLTAGKYGTVEVKEMEAKADNCLDVTGYGDLLNYAFAEMVLKCNDNDGNGKLDFDLAISWKVNEGSTPDCDINDPNNLPYPTNKAKCWYDKNSRIELDIHVPDHLTPTSGPSSEPSSMPSSVPSISSQPSSNPSESPSLSTQPSSSPTKVPSSSPSSQPSVSAEPSSLPSGSPSLSTQPSSKPSSSPSMSSEPSSSPSESPSVSAQPSDSPSESPSVSAQPSGAPSDSPSVSAQPSSSPSESPTKSNQPSSLPSTQPSLSAQPSSSPSNKPSISSAPTTSTESPTASPSISHAPSDIPSSKPSVSSMPSGSPTVAPSAAPSASPTGNLYYPDWTDESQVCKNDGNDPEFMKEVQRLNYLYISKEECCKEHFWWRITQCMVNEHPMYFSNGEFCDQKVVFENWEAKYTPGDWSTSSLFDTVEQCCNAKFWWDVIGCIGQSPKEMTFTFSLDINELIEPSYCQDVDTLANALEYAINLGLGSDSISKVTAMGCIELSQNSDTGNTECGGCLAGASFTGDYDGTRAGDYLDTTGSVTTIDVEVSTKSSSCTDAACYQALYDQMIADFSNYVSTGVLTEEIVNWANAREPNVPELYAVSVDTTSFVYQEPTNPLSSSETTVAVVQVTTTGEFAAPGFDTPISGVEVTTTGSFTVSGLPTLSSTADTAGATTFFEDAIVESLGTNLPEGSTVKVTSISGGVVQYEITTYADSSADATSAIAQIKTTLDTTATLTSITDSVQAESSSLDFSSMAVDSFTEGTSIESSKVKVSTAGEFEVSSFNTASFSPTQIEEASVYFEDAITSSLGNALPEGAYVSVTSIADGVVDYEIVMYADSTIDAGAAATQIDVLFANAATLQAITTSVIAESSSSSDSTLASAMSTASVDTFTKGATTGLTMSTQAEIDEASSYFEAAIIETLGTDLPAGSTVTVTGIDNGVIQYEVTMNLNSSTEADAAVSQINTSFANTATLAAISTAAISDASASSKNPAIVSAMSTMSISNFSAGVATESTVDKITSTGEFSSNMDTSSFTTAQTDETKAYFEDAIATSLGTNLPEGSIVQVTSISGGNIQYEIVSFLQPGGDGRSVVAQIDQALSQTLTMQAISAAVVTASSSSADSTLAFAISTVSLDSFTAGETTGVSYALYYPDWVSERKTCVNNGNTPPYMAEDPDVYTFQSKKECCNKWFVYDPTCMGSTTTSTATKYYPDWENNTCGKKKENELDSYQMNTKYDSLEECCSSKFSYNFNSCCSTPGLGGCKVSGVVKYLPDWTLNKCYAKSDGAVTDSEAVFAESSLSKCCSDNFGWDKGGCCTRSGGC